MTISRQNPIRAEAAAGTQVQSGSSHLFICAECAHAQLYAVQPRALCTGAASPLRGKVVFAGQPACDTLTRREEDDLSLGNSLPASARWRSSFIAAVARGAVVAAAVLLVAAAMVAVAPTAQARPATHAQVARLHALHDAKTAAPAASVSSAPSATSTLLANAAFGHSGALIGGRTRVAAAARRGRRHRFVGRLRRRAVLHPRHAGRGGDRGGAHRTRSAAEERGVLEGPGHGAWFVRPPGAVSLRSSVPGHAVSVRPPGCSRPSPAGRRDGRRSRGRRLVPSASPWENG